MDTQDKLRILADDSRFDLACACGTKNPAEHRQRGADGLWVYPASVPRGGGVELFVMASTGCSTSGNST